MVQNYVMQRDSWASTFPSKMQLLDCFFIQLKIHGTSLNFFILVQVLVQFPEKAPCLYCRPSKFRLIEVSTAGYKCRPLAFLWYMLFYSFYPKWKKLVLSLQMIKYREHHIHILYVAYQIICFQRQLFFYGGSYRCVDKKEAKIVCAVLSFSCNFEQETTSVVKAGLYTY